jgi:hypothetical protein
MHIQMEHVNAKVIVMFVFRIFMVININKEKIELRIEKRIVKSKN